MYNIYCTVMYTIQFMYNILCTFIYIIYVYTISNIQCVSTTLYVYIHYYIIYYVYCCINNTIHIMY